MKINRALLPWVGSCLSKAVSGFAHGALIGGPVTSGVQNDVHAAIKGAFWGGVIGASKDVLLHINENPMPNIFLPRPITYGAPEIKSNSETTHSSP